MYARYQAGDLIPTRYHENLKDGTGKSILFIPLMVEGQFQGIAELQWYERSELVVEE